MHIYKSAYSSFTKKSTSPWKLNSICIKNAYCNSTKDALKMHTTASPTSEHCNFPQRCIKNAYHSFTNKWTLWKKNIFHTSSTPEIATTLELSCWLYLQNGEICKSIASSMWTLRLQLLFLQVINMELCSNEHCQLELWTCFTTFIKYMIIFMYKNSKILKDLIT